MANEVSVTGTHSGRGGSVRMGGRLAARRGGIRGYLFVQNDHERFFIYYLVCMSRSGQELL